MERSVEITEEDHGKAIWVFTTVTTIFLPLSFVTSYLGMNTSDIRGMNSSQGIFWAVAVPSTTIIVGLAFMIAYRTNDTLQWLRGALQFWGRTTPPSEYLATYRHKTGAKEAAENIPLTLLRRVRGSKRADTFDSLTFPQKL